MRRELCLMAALCLLVCILAVAMATEGKTGPRPLAVAMVTEEKTGQEPLSPLENDQRQNSTKLGPEYEQRTTGSNSSVTAAGKGRIHVLLSNDQDKSVLKPSVSQDGKGQMPPDTSNEKRPSSITASPYDPDEDYGTGRLLVAVARTLVTTTASTTTVTVLSTCHSPAPLPTTVCTGRRKRKQLSISITGNSEAGLDSSNENGPVLIDEESVERAGRLILWSSSVTTVIITTTSTNTNTASIVTASYTCSASGLVVCG